MSEDDVKPDPVVQITFTLRAGVEVWIEDNSLSIEAWEAETQDFLEGSQARLFKMDARSVFVDPTEVAAVEIMLLTDDAVAERDQLERDMNKLPASTAPSGPTIWKVPADDVDYTYTSGTSRHTVTLDSEHAGSSTA